MQWWQVGLVANLVVAAAYVGIALAILRPLIATGQVRSNRLGTATAAIFFSCAVHHGAHSVHMLLPGVGVEARQGLAMRTAFDWQAGLWDVVTAGIGIYYWSLRKTYGPLMRGAALFEDMRAREQQALELNDTVLQGLVVAKMALELDQIEKAREALAASASAASRIITDLLQDSDDSSVAGKLIRKTAATLPPTPVSSGKEL